MLYPFSRLCRPAHSPASCGPAARKKRRGFNLIESAIVLGVVGLVIGGIWVAAATVSENHKVNLAVNGTLKAVANINRYFPLPETYLVNVTLSMVNFQTYSFLIYEGVDGFDTSGTLPKSPFGDRYYAALNATSFPGNVQIRFFSVKLSPCIKIIMQLWASASGSITSVQAGSNVVTLPPEITAVTAACDPTISTRAVSAVFNRSN